MASNDEATELLVSSSELLYVTHKLRDEGPDVARYLGLSEEDIDHIQKHNYGNYYESLYQMLMIWKLRVGDRATRTVLADALIKAKRSEVAEDILRGKVTGNVEDHNKIVTDDVLRFVSEHLHHGWLSVGRYLGRSAALLDHIRLDYQGNQLGMTYAMLRGWRTQVGVKATYGALAEALYMIDRRDLADDIFKVASVRDTIQEDETSTQEMHQPDQDITQELCQLLNEHMRPEDCQNLGSLFNLNTFLQRKDQGNRNHHLTFTLWQKSFFTLPHLETLCTGLSVIGRPDLAKKVTAIKGHTGAFTTKYDAFIAHLSTHLTTAAIEKICQYFKLPEKEKRSIFNEKSPGLSCLQHLHERNIIVNGNVSALIGPLVEASLVQAVAKVNEYEVDVRIRLSFHTMQHKEVTPKEKLPIYVKAKLRSWYETMTPLPWRKSCQWKMLDLFISRRLILKDDTKGNATRCKIKYCDMFTHEKLENEDRIVIEGEPGSGKTLLLTQIAYEWSQNKISGADCIFFMPLKLVENAKLSSAIKMFYVPEEDTKLTENDIENVLTDESISCSLLLDGLEEYIGGDINDEADSSEVTRILRKEKYPNCKVVVTARTDFAQYVQGCSKLAIGGFGDTERVDYIRKVYPDDDEKQNQILADITSNQLIREMCEVPLLFVLAVHNLGSTNDGRNEQPRKVTPFMKAMVEAMSPQDERLDSSSLQKLAFEGLCSGTQQLTWPKNFVTMNVDNASKWIESGILVIEENVTHQILPATTYKAQFSSSSLATSASSSSSTTSKNLSQNRLYQHVSNVHAEMVPMRIRFLHKVVQEWFSAKYLSTLISDEVKLSLEKIKPADLHFMLRFTCGHNSKYTHLILHHLWSHYQGPNGRLPEYIEKIFYHCYVEHDVRKDNLTQNVTNACSGEVSFSNRDSRLAIQSKATLLKQAYDLGISIKGIRLEDIERIATEGKFVLTSGATLSSLPTPDALSIELDDNLTDNAMRGLRKFLSEQGRLQQITIDSKGERRHLQDKETLKWLNDQGTQVVTIAKDSRAAYVLNTTTGKWKLLKDIEGMCDEIASKIDSQNWRSVGRKLGLDENQLENINIDNLGNTHEKKVGVLLKWRQLFGPKANAVTLIVALRNSEFNMTAYELSQMFDMETSVAHDD